MTCMEIQHSNFICKYSKRGSSAAGKPVKPLVYRNTECGASIKNHTSAEQGVGKQRDDEALDGPQSLLNVVSCPLEVVHCLNLNLKS